MENNIDKLSYDLTRFTDDLDKNDFILGYAMFMVKKDGDGHIMTECAGGHPAVVLAGLSAVKDTLMHELEKDAK